MSNAPGKLKQDAIIEAVAEIRFEHTLVHEVVIGGLAGAQEFASYSSSRLPLADLPSAFRDNDANLRFQPTLQLQRQMPGEVVKIGPRVVSIHVLAPYVGWDKFALRISAMARALEQAVREIQVTRAGLRYINSLSPAQGFHRIEDLNFALEVGGERPTSEFTTMYRSYGEQELAAQVTLASPVLVEGPSLPDSIAFIDVDVYSRGPLGKVTPKEICDWFDAAHEFEKDEFFRLWPKDILAQQRID